MSGGLAPSKSTVYLSNLPFTLTNNDLHKVLEKYGKIVKITIVKDKDQRKSKGIAFILFLEKESAYRCVQALNQAEVFGRTLKCSIAKDNGRAPEFIKRKEYKDKTKCYECGEEGHLSFQCPKNLLGEREPPPKKKKKTRKEKEEERSESRRRWKKEEEEEEEEDEGEDPSVDSLASAIRSQQSQRDSGPSGESDEVPKKKYKMDSYFSDEEDLSD